MPKRKALKVVEYGAYVPGIEYLTCVVAVRSNLKTGKLLVRLEHLNPDQDGRVQEVLLSLPIHPNGRSASFFRACGMEVNADHEVMPDDVVGKRVIVRFDQEEDDQIVLFQSPVKEIRNGTPAR